MPLIEDDNAYSYDPVTPSSFFNCSSEDFVDLHLTSLSDVNNESEYSADNLWRCNFCNGVNISFFDVCRICSRNKYNEGNVLDMPIAYRTREDACETTIDLMVVNLEIDFEN